MNSHKIVNPNLELEGLREVNRMHNGNATKLILLLKYWNIYWNKPLKSYIIERLVEKIFSECNINRWVNAIKTFFNQAIHIIKNDIHILDRVNDNKSVLDDYTNGELQDFYEAV